MKSSTSFSREQNAKLSCPRRFKFRYLDEDPDGRLAAFRKLMSVRELGGHVVHMALAGMVKRVAAGSRVSEEFFIIDEAVKSFKSIVANSLACEPGKLLGTLQLAETHNSVDATDDIKHWLDIIPVCVENGLRVALQFGLHSDSSDYRLEAEKRGRLWKNGREHRFVVDVLISQPHAVQVIDWKCHSIRDEDLHQVSTYQQYLIEKENVPNSKVYGFAVDLLRERVHEWHYRPIERLRTKRFSMRSTLGISAPAQRNDYAPHPSAAACSICPFAAICDYAALPPPSSSTEATLHP